MGVHKGTRRGSCPPPLQPTGYLVRAQRRVPHPDRGSWEPGIVPAVSRARVSCGHVGMWVGAPGRERASVHQGRRGPRLFLYSRRGVLWGQLHLRTGEPRVHPAQQGCREWRMLTGGVRPGGRLRDLGASDGCWARPMGFSALAHARPRGGQSGSSADWLNGRE